MNWFWKTLKGYKTIVIMPDRNAVITHKPFRKPTVEINRMIPNSIAFDYVLYDESLTTELPTFEEIKERIR